MTTFPASPCNVDIIFTMTSHPVLVSCYIQGRSLLHLRHKVSLNGDFVVLTDFVLLLLLLLLLLSLFYLGVGVKYCIVSVFVHYSVLKDT